jgi:hypothetical protein
MRSVALLIVAFVVACSSTPQFVVAPVTFSGDFDGEHWTGVRDQRVLRFNSQKLNSLNCVISPASDEPFEYYTVHFLPGVPEELGDDWARSYRREDAPAGLRSKTKQAQGQTVVSWLLDEGDPFGTYLIQLFVNGEHIGDLEFFVERALE